MFRVVTKMLDRMVERYLPDPFVIVALLTLIVFGAGLGVEGQSPVQMVDFWGKGFWSLLPFAMQMVLILVTGYVLADTPFFRRALEALTSFAKTPGQAIILVTLVVLAASWVNWGFGLVLGALCARQLARTVPDTDYRLLIASGYSGFIVWHGGLSGSVPLLIATEGNFTADALVAGGFADGIVPTAMTIFSTYNLIILGLLFIIIPLVNRAMLGHGGRVVTGGEALAGQGDEPAGDEAYQPGTPAEHLENSRVLTLALAALGLGYIAFYAWSTGFALNLNIVNFTFLTLGILLHLRPRRFLASVKKAVSNAGGIIIQFPFYAGIMGMMRESGLASTISQQFVEISTATTLPLFTFLSAGLVNIFVPSGGGQWAVQGPIMLEAGQALGADLPRVAMAVAWGDAWTNLIQPFWALPALGIAGLAARDIMGFCLMVLLVTGVVIAGGLVFFPG